MAGHRNVFGHGSNVDKEKAFFSSSAAGGCDIGWRVSGSSDFFGSLALALAVVDAAPKRFSHNFIRTRSLPPLFAATRTHSHSR
jgi:hypothetical protein